MQDFCCKLKNQVQEFLHLQWSLCPLREKKNPTLSVDSILSTKWYQKKINDWFNVYPDQMQTCHSIEMKNLDLTNKKSGSGGKNRDHGPIG